MSIAPQPMELAVERDVEVVELGAVARPRSRLFIPVLLAVAVVLLVGLIAYVGLPDRTDFSLTNAVPNLLQQSTPR